ncbi:MAG: NAD(P)-dependent oxidoreductase, partial [Chloroflexota bacterium]
MRVLITGSEGLIGRVVATHLQTCGWDIRLTDIAPNTKASSTVYTVCDIMNFEAVRTLVKGCDAVVHLAALRNPFYGPGEDIFRINTAGTFNVFEAAAKEGVRRVVQASSINAIGCGWNLGDFTPQYLPIDEDHPIFTTDPYSFSKQIVEDIGAYYWRRDSISSIALRLPGIYASENRNTAQANERRDNMRQYLDSFVKRPPTEQQSLMAQV